MHGIQSAVLDFSGRSSGILSFLSFLLDMLVTMRCVESNGIVDTTPYLIK